MNKEERESMILDNLNLVHFACKKYHIHESAYYSHEDLAQEGVIGLIYAIDRFDPSLGFKFSTYALSYIHGYIKKFMRESFGIFRYSRGEIDSILSGDSCDESIICSLNPIRLDSFIKEEEYSDFYEVLGGSDYTQESCGATFLIDYVFSIIDKKFIRDRDKDILYEYYVSRLILGESITNQELADKYSLSQAYISRLINRLRDYLKLEYCIPSTR